MEEKKVPDYPRLGPEHGRIYELVKFANDHGRWLCDSVDHNEDGGCSNPDCFKHPQRRNEK